MSQNLGQPASSPGISPSNSDNLHYTHIFQELYKTLRLPHKTSSSPDGDNTKLKTSLKMVNTGSFRPTTTFNQFTVVKNGGVAAMIGSIIASNVACTTLAYRRVKTVTRMSSTRIKGSSWDNLNYTHMIKAFIKTLCFPYITSSSPNGTHAKLKRKTLVVVRLYRLKKDRVFRPHLARHLPGSRGRFTQKGDLI